MEIEQVDVAAVRPLQLGRLPDHVGVPGAHDRSRELRSLLVVRTGGGANVMQYSNPGLDAKIDVDRKYDLSGRTS